MRKIFSIVIVAIATVFAMQASAEFRWGAFAGGDISNLRFKQDLIQVDKRYGYSAGVLGEMMFPGIGFGMDFGLHYEQRGAKLHLGEKLMWSSQGYGTENLAMHYAVLPIHLRFKYTRMNGFEDYLAPFAYVGPSFGFLLGHSELDCMKFPFGEVGIDFGFGAEIMRHWQLSASYTLGFTYALKDKTLTDYSARNSSWNFRLTYIF